MSNSPYPDDARFWIPAARPVRVGEDETLHFPYASAVSPTEPLAASLRRSRAAVELLGLLLAWVCSQIMAGISISSFPWSDDRWAGLVGSLLMGLILLVACVAMIQRDRHPIRTIGWVMDRLGSNVAIGVLTLFVVMPALFIGMLILTLAFPEILAERIAAQKAIEQTFPPDMLPYLIPLTLWVAVWEEFVFRGFLLTRLRPLLRNWWLTVTLGALIFSLGHFYQGYTGVMMTFGLGLVMGLLLVWRRSLVPGVVFHFLFNLTQILVLHLTSTTWE
jgi:membrane protease YdiL (CAAX protease family)